MRERDCATVVASSYYARHVPTLWIPAYAGMTVRGAWHDGRSTLPLWIADQVQHDGLEDYWHGVTYGWVNRLGEVVVHLSYGISSWGIEVLGLGRFHTIALEGLEMNKVFIYWDNSNIFHDAQRFADARSEGANARYRVRIDFENLYRLAHADRVVHSAVAAGSVPPEMRHLWNRLESQGIEIKLFDRGSMERGEQEMPDRVLQLRMLEDALDNNGDAGIVVLLTGDGAGYQEVLVFTARWSVCTVAVGGWRFCLGHILAIRGCGDGLKITGYLWHWMISMSRLHLWSRRVLGLSLRRRVIQRSWICRGA